MRGFYHGHHRNHGSPESIRCPESDFSVFSVSFEKLDGGDRRVADSTPESRGWDSVRLRASAGKNDGMGNPARGVIPPRRRDAEVEFSLARRFARTFWRRSSTGARPWACTRIVPDN